MNKKIILLVGLVFVVLAAIFTSIGLYFGKKSVECPEVKITADVLDNAASVDADSDAVASNTELAKYYWVNPSYEEANKEEVYTNPNKYIRFIVPYNDEWVYKDSPVKAYAENRSEKGHEYVSLVPQNYGMASMPPYLLELTFEPKQTPQDGDEVVIIGDLQVIKSVEDGLCFHPQMIVVGEVYNYRFSSTCSDTEEQQQNTFKYMEAIIEKIELLDIDTTLPTYCPPSDEYATSKTIGSLMNTEDSYLKCADTNWWYEAHQLTNKQTGEPVLFYKMSNDSFVWKDKEGEKHTITPFGDVDWVDDFEGYGSYQPATLTGLLLDTKQVNIDVDPVFYEDGGLGGFQDAEFELVNAPGDPFDIGILTLKDGQSFRIDLRTAEIKLVN